MSQPYTVKSGDYLSKIASQNGYKTWQEIYYHAENALFRAKRPNPNLIYPGDVIVLPGKAGPAPAGNSEFEGFSDTQVAQVREDLARARAFADVVVRRLLHTDVQPDAMVADTKVKVRNIFHIDLVSDIGPDTMGEALQWTILAQNFRVLRDGFDQPFKKKFEPEEGQFIAFVVGVDDPTVHVRPRYFRANRDDRAVTWIHERAHTLLRAPGHPGTGDTLFCPIPHEGTTMQPVTQEQAMRNAYCYELLAFALQPDYDPARFRAHQSCQNPPADQPEE